MDYPTQQKPLQAMAGADDAALAGGDTGGRRLAYCIEVYVYEDGTYRVTKESPEAEAAEHAAAGTREGEGGQDYQSPGQVLQAVLDHLRTNPVGDSGQAQLEAGFESR